MTDNVGIREFTVGEFVPGNISADGNHPDIVQHVAEQLIKRGVNVFKADGVTVIYEGIAYPMKMRASRNGVVPYDIDLDQATVAEKLNRAIINLVDELEELVQKNGYEGLLLYEIRLNKSTNPDSFMPELRLNVRYAEIDGLGAARASAVAGYVY